MLPASAVNKNNYHLLGNRLAGESRASRMRRVNNRNSSTPSLLNQSKGFVSKIKGAKPLGDTTPNQLWDLQTPFFFGAAAFIGNGLYRYTVAGGRKSINKKEAELGGKAVAIGTGIANMALASTGQFSPLGALAGIALATGASTADAAVSWSQGGSKGRSLITWKDNAVDAAVYSVPLALPMATSGGNVESTFVLSAINTVAAGAGLYLSSRYIKARRA